MNTPQPARVAFLFDLDGTLLDTERRYTRMWQEIEKTYPTGIPNFPIVIKGTTLTDILNKYFPADTHADIIARLYAMEERMEMSMCEGALSALDSLDTLGIPYALVTSSDSKKMNTVAERFPGFLDRFAAIVKSEDVRHSKPDPEGYLLAAARLGVEPIHCAVVEDSLQGIEAGRRAGALVIGITDTIGSERVVPVSDIALAGISELDIQQVVNNLLNR